MNDLALKVVIGWGLATVAFGVGTFFCADLLPTLLVFVAFWLWFVFRLVRGS